MTQEARDGLLLPGWEELGRLVRSRTAYAMGAEFASRRVEPMAADGRLEGYVPPGDSENSEVERRRTGDASLRSA